MLWSMLQNWGGRVLNLLVFVILARVLTPEQFGVASSAFLILTLLHLLAEFGMGECFVQRRNLQPEDINLPFFISMCVSITLSILAITQADSISRLMGVPSLATYLPGVMLITPFMTMSALQEALYRRELMFKQLTIRTLLGIVIGGIVGVVLALAGFGSWAIIAQFAAQTIVGAAWLWARPVWVPTFKFKARTAWEMEIYGSKALSVYLVDFFTMKSVDFIIVTTYGAASFGLFTIATRLYQLLIQLLQVSISGVGLALLSKISHDAAKMREVYFRCMSLSATFAAPIFFGSAALSAEVNAILYGSHWTGAEQIMTPMLLLGGINCIDFSNGVFLLTLGKPGMQLNLTLFRAAVVFPAVLLSRHNDLTMTATIYCGALLLTSPLSFYVTVRALNASISSLLSSIGAPLIGCCLSFLAVFLAKEHISIGSSAIVKGIAFGFIFLACYLSVLCVFSFKKLQDDILFITKSMRSAKRA
jgi:O-antigen/teichoic acid export membrane protein